MTNGLQNNYRFSFWLPLFAGLLILIPFFIALDLITLAKCSGIIVLILLLVALRKWFALARINNNRVERIVLTINDLYMLKQLLPAYNNLSNADQRILTDQLGLFLAEVQFKGNWSPSSIFSVGILSVLASWQEGYQNKQHWVFCTTETAAFYIEKQPSQLFDLPSAPINAVDLSTLLKHDAVLHFKNEVLAVV